MFVANSKYFNVIYEDITSLYFFALDNEIVLPNITYSSKESYYQLDNNNLVYSSPEIFLHEITHFFIQVLFNNDYLPYSNELDEQCYKQAIVKFLLGIASKLALDVESDDYLEVLDSLKHDGIIDLFAVMAMPHFTQEDFSNYYEQELSAELIDSLHQKYIEEISYDSIIHQLVSQIQNFELSFDEIEMYNIAVIGRIIYQAPKDTIVQEFIATSPELHYLGKYDEQIWHPIEKCWVDYSHSVVEEFMSGDILDKL